MSTGDKVQSAKSEGEIANCGGKLFVSCLHQILRLRLRTKNAPCISLREKRGRPHALYDGMVLFRFYFRGCAGEET